MNRRLPRGLPRCRAKGRPSRTGLRFCACLRCVVVRDIALRRVGGADSAHPGAAVTRALTENA